MNSVPNLQSARESGRKSGGIVTREAMKQQSSLAKDGTKKMKTANEPSMLLKTNSPVRNLNPI
jgi:hypothetical protein